MGSEFKYSFRVFYFHHGKNKILLCLQGPCYLTLSHHPASSSHSRWNKREGPRHSACEFQRGRGGERGNHPLMQEARCSQSLPAACSMLQLGLKTGRTIKVQRPSPRWAQGDKMGVWVTMAVRTEDLEKAEAHPGVGEQLLWWLLGWKDGIWYERWKGAFQVGEVA